MPRKYMKSSVSWEDVENDLLALQEEYQVYAEVVVKPLGVGLARVSGLGVALVLTRIEGGGGKGGIRRFRSTFPTYHQRKLPGLILQLVHDARESLTAGHIVCRKQSKVGSYLPG